MKIKTISKGGLFCLVLAAAAFLSLPVLAATPSPSYMEEFYQLAPKFLSTPAPELDIPQALTITQPAGDTETYQDFYFVSGYSNPQIPLLLDGEELERLGTQGVFGLTLGLVPGENQFRFSQEGESWTVDIYRHTEATTTPVVADGILSYSMVPSAKSVYRVGDILILSCTAPKGAEVQVKIGGDTVPLTQWDLLGGDGLHDNYEASYTLPSTFPTLKTTSLGHLTYQMTLEGETRDFESLGELYVAGKDAKIRGEVSTYTGFVYPDLNDLSLFKELLKKGTIDYITNQQGEYYQLASGGSIPRYMMDIQESGEEITNEMTKVESFNKAGGEVFALSGSQTPAYDVEVDEDALTLLVYHSTLGETKVEPTLLFSNITTEQTSDGVLMTFTFNKSAGAPSYWGYNVVYSPEGTLYLEVEYKPPLATGPHPLQGIKIVLDPGHGGDDPGSLGITGEVLPYEEQINLAHALALERRLSALGATVIMTRYGDDTVELDDRFRLLADTKADLFVSLHHNSVEMLEGYENSYGTEAYYHTPQSAQLSQSILTQLAAETQRVPRGSFQSYYRVTLLPYAPSVLVELGFISHPLEFEKACTPKEINATSTGIVNGILEALA